MTTTERILSSTTLTLWFILASISPTHAATDSPQALTGDWLYHWGDLPKNAAGEWQFKDNEWSPIDFPENIPDRHKHKIVWLKIDLPSGNWRDPYLYINAIDLNVEVFHKRERIYDFGAIDQEGNSHFEGWPWHIIKLPLDYHEHSLFLRVTSDYPSIGLSGEVILGNKFDLIDKVYRSGITGLSFVLVILLVGIISTIIGCIKQDKFVAFSTGILSFNIALMIFSENELSQEVLFEPLFWSYIAAFTYFIIPAFLAIIVYSWLKHKTPFINGIVFITPLLFAVCVGLLSIYTSFNFVNAYPYFDVLFILLVLALLSGCLKQFYKQGTTGILMVLGILALFIALVIDMLSAHGLINWIGKTEQWGLVLFTFSSLIIYFVKDWEQQIAYRSLIHELEEKVRISTSELENSQEHLNRLAREDYLTGFLNRRAFSERRVFREQAIKEVAKASLHQHPISLLLFDLDHFKDVNDIYGNTVGDIILKEVATISSQTSINGELVCRYGGEEFVVLLHDTEANQAECFSERLQSALKKIEIHTEDILIKASDCFGLITIDCSTSPKRSPEQIVDLLLIEADNMMYQAKVSNKYSIKVI